MRCSSALLLAALAALTSAVPLGRRAVSDVDKLVLTFADVLEQLETQFYDAALKKFSAADFTNAGFADSIVPIEQFQAIRDDEAAHASVLEGTLAALGAKPLSCKFNFDSALTDVKTMAATARTVENVGVSAYLGAASLLSDPAILTAAGSILTVEARHQTILNLFSGGGSAIPQAFDIALTPNEVLAIASPFISGCDLGVPANQGLALKNQGGVGIGTKLEFDSPALKDKTDGFGCQMLTGGAAQSIALPLNACVVPPGVNGPVAVFVTRDQSPLPGDPRKRTADKVVAGPLLAFIDSQNEKIAGLAFSGSNGGSNSGSATTTSSSSATTTTSTISPSSASAIVSSATASAGAAGATATTINASFANNSTGPTQDNSVNVLGWTFPQ